MLACLGMSDLTAAEKVMMGALAFHDGKQCSPGIARLMELTGYSRPSVKRLLGSLRKKGRISSKLRGPKTTALYTLNYQPKGINPDTPKGINLDTQKVSDADTQTGIEPEIEPGGRDSTTENEL